MWSPAIVIGPELSNHTLEVSLIHWNQIIQTLAANRPDYSFAVRVRHLTSNRSLQYVQAKPTQCFVDLRAARMVPIHYDTFVSTDERGVPLRKLEEARSSVRRDPAFPIVPLAIGEQRVFVRAGEDPAKVRPRAAPSKAAPAVTTTPPPKKQEIPEDDRLD